jgi:HSP20 family protein
MTYLTLRNKAPFERLFDDFWNLPAARESNWAPAADIFEEDTHFLLALEVPGVKRDDIKIEVEGDRVVISGERKATDDKRSLYGERRFGSFERAFTLPANADSTKIEAKYEDGVLSVVVPKAEAAKPRVVKVS